MPENFKIADLQPDQPEFIEQCAHLLVDGFRNMAPDAWPTLAAGREELAELLNGEFVNRIAVNTSGTVIGWIGAQPHYEGKSWELHPLVVRPGSQRCGVGSALMRDLESLLIARGVASIWLGSDDEVGLTSLYGIDLYPNVLEKLAKIQNRRNHPFSFYQKHGFTIVGVLPDANGIGKPDILMAKRLINPERN